MVNEVVQLRGVSGRRFWVTLSVSLIDLDQQPHLLAVANDITELRELNDRLSYQASHDELTDLYNRREFERRLRSEEHTSELQSLMRISYAVFCLKKKKIT